MSLRTSLEEGIKPHWFAGILPEQLLTEAGGHCEAVVAANQRMIIRCFRNDLADFVHYFLADSVIFSGAATSRTCS